MPDSDHESRANDQLAALVHAGMEDQEIGSADLESSVLVRLDQHWFALSAASVREVVAAQAVTPVPGSPQLILGVTQVHGQLIPVVDLAAMVGIGAVGSASGRLVIVATGDEIASFMADEARGVVDVPHPNATTRARPVVGELHEEDRTLWFLDANDIVHMVAEEA